MRTDLLLAALALSTACCGGSRAEPAETPPPEPAPAADVEQPAVQDWMRTHFVEGRGIRDAIVRGELESARSRLAEVSRQPGPAEAPPEWQPHLQDLRQAAADAAEGDSLAAVATGFGTFAARCAECHTTTGAEPSFEGPELPAPDQDAPAPMVRHQWAAEQMWQGLVAPSEARFVQGAEALAAAPLHPAELVVGNAPPLDVIRASEQARELAGGASRAETPAERAALYGELLATCAACHGQL